ncbi:MAG: hypothetical protein V3V10_07965, partial [Planctomycetota bacterium]
GVRAVLGMDSRKSFETEARYLGWQENGHTTSNDGVELGRLWRERDVPNLDRKMKFGENGMSPEQWRVKLDTIRKTVDRLAERNVRVLFVRMPSSYAYAEWENKHYPRDLYWDQLQTEFGPDALHFKDSNEMAKFVPSDGSHLFGDEPARFSKLLGRWIAERLKAQ